MTRHLARIIAALAILGTATACTATTFVPPSPRPSLSFVGDSITYLSTDDITAHYSPNYMVSIDGIIGVDTYMMGGHVVAAAATSPTVAVLDLGTNDASNIVTPPANEPLSEQTVAAVNGRLDRMVAMFAPSTCVVVVTVTSHNEKNGAGPYAAQIDDHVRSTFAHVADWDAAYDPTFYDAPDNPHPNAAGRQALLAVEDRAISAC